ARASRARRACPRRDRACGGTGRGRARALFGRRGVERHPKRARSPLSRRRRLRGAIASVARRGHRVTRVRPVMKAPLSRRRFLQISAVVAAVGRLPLGGRVLDELLQPSSGSTGSVLPGFGESEGPFIARAGSNLLVVIELSGGHDGFSTIVPSSDRAYRRLR